MHTFMTDETNKNFVAGQFFIYGGLVATDEQLIAVHEAVAGIRDKYGYLPGDSFKFHTHSRPSQVTVGNAKAAKQEVVERLGQIGVRMIVYVILHDIAQSKSESEVMNYALNTVAARYHRLLEIEQSHGLMVIDRADDQHGHLENLFQHGIKIDGWSMRLDDRILSFAMTSDNTTHLSSAVDIALGAFRYCVNTAGGHGRDVVATDIFPPLAELVWGIDVNGIKQVGGYGYVARPQNIRVPAYANKYAQLGRALENYSNASASELPSVNLPSSAA